MSRYIVLLAAIFFLTPVTVEAAHGRAHPARMDAPVRASALPAVPTRPRQGIRPGAAPLTKASRVKILSVIVEQRVKARPSGWWVQDTDLSVLEVSCAEKLAQHGIDVLKPAAIKGLMDDANMKPVLHPRDCSFKNWARLSGARYILRGRVVVSKGVWKKGPLKAEQYVSVIATLVDVFTGKTAARVDVWGKGPKRDPAGVEAALRDAGEHLALRVIGSFAGKGE